MARLQESPQSLEGGGKEKPVLRGMTGTVPTHTVDMIIFVWQSPMVFQQAGGRQGCDKRQEGRGPIV